MNTTHAPQNIPDTLRSWSTPWPGYAPVDITPPELRTPDRAAAQKWVTDTATDPADVPDLRDRQAAALIPWTMDDHGRPLNPHGRTGRTGRNLRAWGENASADPIALAGHGLNRKILLIQRSDCGHWAFPGGHIDPGETSIQALARELHEETGLDLSHLTPRIVARTVVDDPRNTDYAWIATVAATYHLTSPIPPTPGDDAADADWWPAASFAALDTTLRTAGQQVYEAHQDLLIATLGAALPPSPKEAP